MTEIALPGSALTEIDRPGWKTALNWIGAILTAALFLFSGPWKIVDLPRTATFLHQLKVPENLSLPAAFALGISETLAGVLVLVPRFRRWGAWLASLLLVVFMIYIGIFYNELHGQDCSCFPLVKRAVTPMFFPEDGVMLLLAVLAGWWARKSEGLRIAGLILGALVVFAAVSLGVELGRNKGTLAPASITVEGKPFSLREGKVYIFIFDPPCSHCRDAAIKMSKMNWGDTKVVVVPSEMAEAAHEFLQDAHLSAGVSNDQQLLQKTFNLPTIIGGRVATPFAIAIENGREVATMAQFGEIEPEATLKKIHFIY